MVQAARLAAGLRKRYGIVGLASEADVDGMLADKGLAVSADRPYVGSVRGLLLGDRVLLRAGMDLPWRKVVKAHELGHHICGHGGQGLYLVVPTMRVYTSRSEAEAQIFAGVLLIGSPSRRLYGERVQEALDDGLPIEFVASFLRALGKNAAPLADSLEWRTPAQRMAWGR